MEISAELILFAKAFPAEDVFDEIGINTGCIDISEEMIYKTLAGDDFKKEQECSISYSTQALDTIQVVDVLNDMCSILEDKVHIIKSAIEKYKLTAKICITLNLTDEPEIVFTQKFIQMAAFLGCSIEVDSYLNIDKTMEYDDSDSDTV